MAELDRGAKIVLQYRAVDLVGFAFPGAVLRGPVENEVSSAQFLLDGVLEGEVDGETVTMHFEFEAEPSSGATAQAARNACGLLHRYQRPVRTTIVYLHAAKDGRRPPRTTLLHIGEKPLEVSFRVVALWEDVDAAAVVAGTTLGLLPFVGLMRATSLEQIGRAAERIGELAPDRPTRAELTAALFLLSGHGFTKKELFGIMNNEVLMESSTYRATIELGRVEGRVEVMGRQLRRRLGDEATPFVARLSGAPDATLERVEALIVDLSDASALRRELESLLPPPSP